MWRSCRQVPLLGGWLASGLGTRLLCAALQLAGWGGDAGGNAGSSDALHARTAGIALVAAPAGIGAPPAAAPRCARPEASILKPRACPQAVKPGMWEFQAESLYLHSLYAGGGCRLPHYTPIFASGPNAGRNGSGGQGFDWLAACLLVAAGAMLAGQGRDALRHGRVGSSRGPAAAPFASPCCASPTCFARCPPK